MKLHYKKVEIENMIERKCLFAIPMHFNDGVFKWHAHLTTLRSGFIRADLWMFGKLHEIFFYPHSSYKDIRKGLKEYYNILNFDFDDGDHFDKYFDQDDADIYYVGNMEIVDGNYYVPEEKI